MEDTKHTPGPWAVRITGESEKLNYQLGIEAVVETEFDTICGLLCEPDDEAANARLIASAPELLAALDKLAKEIIGCLGIAEPEMRACLSNTNVNILRLRVEEAFAAIAKAKGK
jgi:hypothetical protein